MLALTTMPWSVKLTYEEEEALWINYEPWTPWIDKIRPVRSNQRCKQKRELLKICYILKQSNENAGKLADLSAKTLVRWRKIKGIEALVQERKHIAGKMEVHTVIYLLNSLEYERAESVLMRILSRPRKKLPEYLL